MAKKQRAFIMVEVIGSGLTGLKSLDYTKVFKKKKR